MLYDKKTALVVKDAGGSHGCLMPHKGTKPIANKQYRYRKPEVVKALEQALYDRKIDEAKMRCPNLHTFDHIVKPTFRDDTANGLTKCIIAHIQLHGGQAERISTTGRPIDRRETFTDVLGRTRTIGSMKWIPGTSTRGSADISATIQGISVKIEVKIGRDRQSEAQKNYQKSIEQAGGEYFIARDFDEFLTWFNDKFGHNE